MYFNLIDIYGKLFLFLIFYVGNKTWDRCGATLKNMEYVPHIHNLLLYLGINYYKKTGIGGKSDKIWDRIR